MACIRPMTPVLFVGFGVGAWAAAAAPSAAIKLSSNVRRARMTFLLGRSGRGLFQPRENTPTAVQIQYCRAIILPSFTVEFTRPAATDVYRRRSVEVHL